MALIFQKQLIFSSLFIHQQDDAGKVSINKMSNFKARNHQRNEKKNLARSNPWIIQTRNGEINQEKICVYFLSQFFCLFLWFNEMNWGLLLPLPWVAVVTTQKFYCAPWFLHYFSFGKGKLCCSTCFNCHVARKCLCSPLIVAHYFVKAFWLPKIPHSNDRHILSPVATSMPYIHIKKLFFMLNDWWLLA